MNPIENLFNLQTAELRSSGTANPDLGQLRAQIPEPILAHYDRFMARGKTGVALVRNQTCSGCHMRIPIGTLNTLLHNQDIQLCDNCGRYLYLPPASATSPQPHAPPSAAEDGGNLLRNGPLQTSKAATHLVQSREAQTV